MFRLSSITNSFVLALAGLSGAQTQAAQPSLCEEASAVIGDLACVETARGIAMAGDGARARQLSDLAEAGANRFTTHFGQMPARYAIVEGPDALVPADRIEALRKAGFKAALPWLSDTVFRQQQEQSIRRAVTAQLAGRPPEVIEAAVKAGLQQMNPERRSEVERAAVPHELGHVWFRLAYWPTTPGGGNQHYGGPAPDWIDEMSAVLMEAPDMFDDRITQFGERYAAWRANPAAASENTKLLLDIENFFAEEHPAAAQVKLLLAARAEGDKKNPVLMLAGDEASKIADGSVRFYQQAAVVSQYLAERTGDPQVFNRIASAFARGETIAQWLANPEPKGALPRDLKAVQADWLAWLDQRFPASGPSS